MPSAEGLPEDLKSFEAELSTLAPLASRIDRDRLMYRLGEQAAVVALDRNRAGGARLGWRGCLERPRLWQAAALVLACTSVGLGSLLVASPRTVDRVVYVPRPAVAPPNTLPASPDRAGDPKVDEPPSHAILAGNRARLKPNERWLTSLASPGSRYSQNAELRARAPRIASDPGAPILVVEQRQAAGSANKISNAPGAPLLRWSDHRQMIELLNPASH